MNDICFWSTFAFYILNVIAFVLYGYDKHLAYFCKRRIPEAVLLSSTILWGGLGSFVGMKLFRHKTQKKRFKITTWICLPLSLVVLWLIYFIWR